MSATARLARTQVRRGARRVVAIALAALLSAMAVMATGTFITNMQRSLNLTLAAPYTEADFVVETTDPHALEVATSNENVAVAELVYSRYATGQIDGRQLQLTLQSVPQSDALRWLELTDGSWPAGADDIALTQADANNLGLHLGDTLPISTGLTHNTDATLVGIVKTPVSGGMGMTQVYTSGAFMTTREITPSAAIVTVQAGASVSETIKAVNAQLASEFGTGEDEPEALAVDDYTAKVVDKLASGTNMLATMFLIFVAIAALAAAMVIRNTFQVLLAQRLRENGLLRLVGATGGQVQRMVLHEALIIAVVGGVLGVAAGFALGSGIAAIAGMLPGFPEFPIIWAVAALLATIAITVLAAWAPAARLRRLSPVAALSEAQVAATSVAGRSVAGWVIGSILTVLGIGAVTFAAMNHDPLLLVLSGLVLAVGLIILVPLLTRAIMPAIARLLATGGPVARLAGENLVRTARRSGAVVLSIALGGSLILAMLTAVNSIQATLNKQLDEQFNYDALLTSSSAQPLPNDLSSVLDSEGLESSEAAAGVPLQQNTELPNRLVELVVMPAQIGDKLEPALADNEVLLAATMAATMDVSEGDELTLTDTDGTAVTLTVHIDRAMDFMVDYATLETYGAITANTAAEFSATTENTSLWLFAKDGRASDLAEDIAQAQRSGSGLVLLGPLGNRQLYEQIAGTAISFTLGMLALTVVISVIGLASVMALAVAERRKELALLRALGTTRGHVRRLVLIEAVMLALVGAAFSVIIGVPLGIAGVCAVVDSSFVPTIALPVLGIAAVIVAALALGALAGARPARLAAKIPPAQALAQS